MSQLVFNLFVTQQLLDVLKLIWVSLSSQAILHSANLLNQVLILVQHVKVQVTTLLLYRKDMLLSALAALYHYALGGNKVVSLQVVEHIHLIQVQHSVLNAHRVT